MLSINATNPLTEIVNQPPPTVPPTNKTNFAGNLGRKIKTTKEAKEDVHQIHKGGKSIGENSSATDDTKRKRRGVTNIDELDRMLEADTQVLLNMKKDIHQSQHQEVLLSLLILLLLQLSSLLSLSLGIKS